MARRVRPPVTGAGEPPAAPSDRHLDLALLVLSVAAGLALVLVATATFIQVVRG